jgi:hypothetical protein
MKIRSFLLGTATALVVGGAAHAADLSVAEPVDYVRVCDAFGAGYFYAPGTDTCLSIAGWARFDANVEGVHLSSDVYSSSSYSTWDFNPQAYLMVTAKSMTDWGPLTGYFAFFTGTSGSAYGNVVLDEAYLSIGPLLAGYTESLFNYDGLLTLDNNNGDGLAYSRGNVDQIRLSWAMNGFGLAIGLEDYGSGTTTSIGPDIVAAITGAAGGVSGKLAFVYSDYADQEGAEAWAVNFGLTFNLDSLAAGDKLLLAVAYGNPYYSAGNIGNFFWAGDDALSVLGSFKHYFAPNLSTAVSVSYASGTFYAGDDADFWGVNWNVQYAPVKNLYITPELRWHHYSADYYGANYREDDWTAMLRLERDFP